MHNEFYYSSSVGSLMIVGFLTLCYPRVRVSTLRYPSVRAWEYRKHSVAIRLFHLANYHFKRQSNVGLWMRKQLLRDWKPLIRHKTINMILQTINTRLETITTRLEKISTRHETINTKIATMNTILEITTTRHETINTRLGLGNWSTERLEIPQGLRLKIILG